MAFGDFEKSLLVTFFYGQIREIAEKFVGRFAPGMVDYVLAAIGYWKKDTWWGKGLLYGALANIGATMGAGLLSGFMQPTTTQAQKVGPYPIKKPISIMARMYAQG